MTPITLKQLPIFVKQAATSFIRFTDGEKETIVPYNVKKGVTSETVDKFIEKMNSAIYPDGLYYMTVKDTINGREKFVEIIKGDHKIEEPVETVILSEMRKEKSIAPAPIVSDNKYSELWDQYQSLKLENSLLQFEIEKLTEQLEEYEDGLGEAEETKTIEFIKEVGIPLLDKFFDIEERKLAAKGLIPPTKAPVQNRSTMVKRVPFQRNTTTPQNSAGSSQDQPEEIPQQNDVEYSEEERQYIETLLAMSQDEIIDLYNQSVQEGSNEQLFIIISAIRPDASEIFQP